MSSAKKEIVSSPMSYSGSASRTLNWVWRGKTDLFKWLVGWWAVAMIVMLWWSLITMWYCVFGLWLVPYRLLRRGARKRKITERQHQELLAAIKNQNTSQG